jgi:cobalamin biosynthetic protein CobC
MLAKGARLHGGCSLFRLYELRDAKAWQAKLGQHHIWSRIFPYSKSFLRLGLPAQSHWARIEKALS